MKRRLRLDEQPHARIWEIAVEGAVITLHAGLEHTPGVARRIEQKSADAALLTAQRLVDQRIADGFKDAPLAEWDALTPSSSDAVWLVYADSLQMQGDVRGELIALGARGDEKKAASFLRKHEDALLGDLAGVTKQVELEWKLGFITRARITNEPKRRHAMPIESVLTALFNSPSVRMLQRLELGWPGGHFNQLWYTPVLLRLCDLQWPAHLSTLEIGAFDAAAVKEWPLLHSLTPLQRRPQLKYLSVRCLLPEMSAIAHPALRHLELDGPALTHRTFADLLESELPALRGLVLNVGAESVMTARHLTPLASTRFLPELAALGVRQCPEVTTFVGRLIDSGRLPRLSLLDLSENGLNETDGRWLLENAQHFSHLARFVLRRNHFRPRILQKLKQTFPVADLSEQRA